MRNYTPQYGWEDTYLEGFIEYDGNEYGGRTIRRNDEVEIPCRVTDLTRLTPENRCHYPFASFLQRPKWQLDSRNVLASFASGNGIPTSLILGAAKWP